MCPAHRDRRGLSRPADAPAGSQTRGARSETRKISASTVSDRPFGPRQWLAPAAIACAAAVLLFWNLTDTYLWQDEANTAVLAVRLLKYGRPLAYDGRNLLSDDNFAAQDTHTIDERTKDPGQAVADCIRRGTMTVDRMWSYHPWGQFVLAGLSIRLLGQTTFAARLPFALAGLATVFALYWLLWHFLRSELIAALACALLTLNVYWLLHSRQARYYPLTSLFFVLTLIAYGRWQQGARWGATMFVVVAWCWFQIDYGTVWPVLGVVFIDAFAHSLQTHWKAAWKPLATGLALAAAIAPFILFYRLATRQSGLMDTWLHRFKGAVFNINEFVVPVVVLLAALVWLVTHWRRLPPFESRLIVLGCAMVVFLSVWVATVAPTTYVRYVIMAAPVGSMLTAWLFVRAFGSYAPRAAWLACAVVALTPWLCKPLTAFWTAPRRFDTGMILRSELSLIRTDIFGHRPDPNRLVIEWLQKHSTPRDEILVNYEDLPMMYYLPNLIRGGVVAFRAEDDGATPPRFAVIRRTVPFVYWPVFAREVARYYWTPVPVKAPDIRWGNNPDPVGHLQDRARAPDLLIFERREL
jgi:hypothetical protein